MQHDDSISILTSALQREQFPLNEWKRNNRQRSPEVKALPFYEIVPKDPIQQMRWRLYVRERAAIDLEFRAAVKYAYHSDILFAFNTFFYIFEARPTGRRLPFNTWGDQDNYITWTRRCMDIGRDVGIEKCRGIGFSYLTIGNFYHDWSTMPMSALGIMSYKMDGVVDDKENPDALLWKLEYLHKQMPQWMRQDSDGKDILDRSISNHKFSNKANGATVYGYEATSNPMSGGRKRAVLHDEAAKYSPGQAQEAWNSTQHVTNCRIAIATYFRGTTTVFYKIMREEESSMLKIHAHWLDNEERTKGLYTFVNGELQLLDKEYKHPPDYKFIDVENERDAHGNPPRGQKTRSPWYDAECSRPGATRTGVAEELDIDPKNATTQLLDDECIEKATRTSRPPTHRGKIDPGTETNRFKPLWIHSNNGHFRLWAPLNSRRCLSGGPFAVGADIAGGMGGATSSNSALVAFDVPSGEQIGIFYSNRIRPTKFAQLAFSFCKWLADDRGQNWVTFNFESNGSVGEEFYQEFIRLGWGNVFGAEDVLQTRGKKSKKIGWRSGEGKKSAILGRLQRAILEDTCTIRSEMIAAELGQYQLLRGKVIHAGSHYSPDGDEVGDFHGDCAIAAAVGWMPCEKQNVQTQKDRAREIPPGSLAARVLADQRSSGSTGDSISDWWKENGDDDGDRVQNPLLDMIYREQENRPQSRELYDPKKSHWLPT